MSAWTWSAEIGILFGVVAFALIFFPVIAVQYRKYGRFTALRLLGAGAVSVYVTTLIAYTLLPLPVSREAACTPQLQLVPFHFVADIAAENPGSGVLALLTSRATLQVVFNVVLFVPLGIIAPGYFSRTLPVTVALLVSHVRHRDSGHAQRSQNAAHRDTRKCARLPSPALKSNRHS